MSAFVKGCPTPARCERQLPNSRRLRAGVGQASEEETAGHAARPPLADAMANWWPACNAATLCSTGVRGGRGVDREIGAGSCAARQYNWLRLKQSGTPKHGISLTDLAAGPMICANRADRHWRSGMAGGARIVCPRRKVSTMVMGRPQCPHTNVGRRSAQSRFWSASDWSGRSEAAGAASRRRASAMSALRLPLASRP